MNRWKKPVAGLAIVAASAVAGVVGIDFVNGARYARAAQEVEATRQQLATVQDLAAVFKMVGKAVEPSVVKIDVHRTVRAANSPHTEDFLERFFPDRDGDGEPDIPEEFRGFQMPDREFDRMGTGSGVIMEVDGESGYILTNNHVAGGATELSVTLYDGREISDAQLVGADPKTDLALVKINAEGLIPAKWGNSDYLEKGEIICAFGSPFGYVGSMTHGIVSALNRDRVGIIDSRYAYENFIQVDAPINPGNSGGPLVNLRGEVVGINTAIATRTGAFSGIGFAIPSNQARFVYDQIKENGRVVRGWLGVEIQDVATVKDEALSHGYEGSTGILVRGVQRNAPAEGQLELGDVIVGINGKKAENMSQLRNSIARTPPNTDISLRVVRAGEEREVKVTLGEQPDDITQIATATPSRPDTVNFEQLGLRLTTPTPQLLNSAGIEDATSGALVTMVQPGSPAFVAALQQGDLIVKIDGKPIKSPKEANAALAEADLTKGVRLEVVNKEGRRLLFLKTSGR